MEKTIYALGFFDGVHLGHRALLNTCRELARQAGCASGVVTFGNHPDALVQGNAPVLIQTPEDRQRLLLSFVEREVVLPFDGKLQHTAWQDFLERLRREHGAAGFVCGDDFRFGDRGAGNAGLLAEYCRREGLPCAVVPEQTIDGVRVSSTAIRTLLEQGQMATAVRFLGHPYAFTGRVVHGKQLGRTLGFPTANLALPKGIAVPRLGVYACRVTLDGVAHPAVTNVGTRPTVDGHGVNMEVWILDYDGDLYDREITVEFYEFLRPEQKFGSLEALQQEIFRNARQARAVAGRG